MSIQSTMNQMLFTAQMGTGLYVNSPKGRERQAVKSLEKKDKALGKAITENENASIKDIERGGHTTKVHEAYEATNQTLMSEQTGVREELMKLDPNDERADALVMSRMAEELAMNGLNTTVTNIQNSRSGLKERKEGLKNGKA